MWTPTKNQCNPLSLEQGAHEEFWDKKPMFEIKWCVAVISDIYIGQDHGLWRLGRTSGTRGMDVRDGGANV